MPALTVLALSYGQWVVAEAFAPWCGEASATVQQRASGTSFRRSERVAHFQNSWLRFLVIRSVQSFGTSSSPAAERPGRPARAPARPPAKAPGRRGAPGRGHANAGKTGSSSSPARKGACAVAVPQAGGPGRWRTFTDVPRAGARRRGTTTGHCGQPASCPSSQARLRCPRLPARWRTPAKGSRPPTSRALRR
jgi:hypothetical protein